MNWILFAASLALLGNPAETAADGTSPYVAPEDEALLVFIQNRREDAAEKFVVFDPNRNCIARVGGRQAKLVPMKQGRHTLYVGSYNNNRLELSLEAGRTYFVRLYTTEKVATRVSDAVAVQRGSDAYRSLKTWLQGSRITDLSDDDCRGEPPDKRAKRTQKRLNDANADWKDKGEEFRMRHLLISTDGLTADELSWL